MRHRPSSRDAAANAARMMMLGRVALVTTMERLRHIESALKADDADELEE